MPLTKQMAPQTMAQKSDQGNLFLLLSFIATQESGYQKMTGTVKKVLTGVPSTFPGSQSCI